MTGVYLVNVVVKALFSCLNSFSPKRSQLFRDLCCFECSTRLLKTTDWYLLWDCTVETFGEGRFVHLVGLVPPPPPPDMAGYIGAGPQGPINACSHHPPLPKLGVVKTLKHWADNVPDQEKRERAHQEHHRNMRLPGISLKYKKQTEKTRKRGNTKRS